jgi:hypothetical protein
VPETTDSCADCERLRAQVRRLREERDAALLSVARERERANAAIVSQSVPVLAGSGARPIRYWAVDALNNGLKRALPLPHAGAKAALEFLRRFRKDSR